MSHFSIIGTPLYQWESGRKLQIVPLSGMRVNSVHFSNYGDSNALVVEPKEKDGVYIANIPNILLCDDKNIVVYSVNVSEDKTETLRECVFAVRKRAKPSDYVYTETEVKRYESLEERIKKLEDSGGSGGIVDQTYNPESANPQSGTAVAEAILSVKPAFYEGTKVATPKNITNGYVGVGEVTSDTDLKVDEFFFKIKVGDFYYNTDEEKTYVCIRKKINDTQTSAMSWWRDLSLPPDIDFNPESNNAQSGIAVAQAIEQSIGDISTALDELHIYAQALINGGDTE